MVGRLTSLRLQHNKTTSTVWVPFSVSNIVWHCHAANQEVYENLRRAFRNRTTPLHCVVRHNLSWPIGRSAGPTCPGCIALCMRSPTGKEDFLWVCCRRVTEPALLSDDQLSACSISLSLLSDPPSTHTPPPPPSSHLIIAPSLSQSLHCMYPPHHPLPLSTAEEAKQRRPTHPPESHHPLMHPTHRLSCFIANRFSKSTCGQRQFGLISSFLITWPFCLIKNEPLDSVLQFLISTSQ